MGKLQDHHLKNVGERETHRVDPGHHERFHNPERIERLKPAKLVAEFDLDEGTTVIDLGCGDGLFFKPLAEAVGTDGTVIGLDIEPEMVEASKETIQEHDLDTVEVMTNENDEIDLPDNTADAAIMVNTLHEMAYPEATLIELRRVLKPGGRVLVFDRHKEETGEAGPPKHHLISREEALDFFGNADFEYVRDINWDPDMYSVVFQLQS